MTRKDSGHFAAKHPPGTNVSAEIEQEVRAQLASEGVTCRKAHEIAASLGVDPREIGIAMDLQEGYIEICQLGLFGYGKTKKAVKPAQNVDPELETAIKAALTDNHLTCADAWRIADAAGIKRMAVASACEALGIKIIQCQLGAF